MKWIFNNVGLKIGAFIIAILLWFHVVTERVVYETIKAPIIYHNLSDSLVIVNTSSEEVSFQIKTKVKQLILLNVFGHPFSRIDLSSMKGGKNEIKPSLDWLILPSWRPLDVIGVISPQELSIETEKKGNKKVSIKPLVIGSPSEGYFVRRITLEPDSVMLTGGKKSLRKVSEVITDTVDISRRSKGFELDVSLIVPGKSFSGNIGKVKLSILFDKYAKKTLNGVYIIIKSDKIVKVYPESLTVTVSGPQELLDDISASDIKAFVDIKGYQIQATPFFNLPKGIALETCEPQKVEVRPVKSGDVGEKDEER